VAISFCLHTDQQTHLGGSIRWKLVGDLASPRQFVDDLNQAIHVKHPMARAGRIDERSCQFRSKIDSDFIDASYPLHYQQRLA
jgi:hypothetical protein